MIRIYVKKQSSYPVSTPKLKSSLKSFLKQKGIVSDSIVDVSLVSEKAMRIVSRKYLKDKILHNVLSFTESELENLPSGKRVGFAYPPDGFNRLGEIVVCYPKAVEEASVEGILVEEKVFQLVKHGAEHLLGIHHS
ncbi:rRNA maturation RNase YbeY [Patescibacteria group bacterium]|nr:rRNA maturation RNase YbeY [Patescibacteria group bacterium]